MPALRLLLLLYLTLSAAYLFVIPRLEGHDSIAHMNYVNFLRSERRLPEMTADAVAFSYELVVHPPLYYMAGAAATALLPYADADEWVRSSENVYFPDESRRWTVDLPDQPRPVTLAVWIVRLVSLAGGVAALVCTWLLVAHWFPGRPSFALAVLAAMAFNPLFLFMSVSVSNDIWATALTAAVLWRLAVTPFTGPRRAWGWVLVGVLSGLAVLTKYSATLTALPALTLLLMRRDEWTWRTLAAALGLALLGALASAGFWFGRNVALYGEVIPLGAAGAVLPTLRRAEAMSLPHLWRMLPWLFHSYWGVFVSVIAPPAFLRTVQLLTLVAGGGLLVAAVTRRLPNWRILTVIVVWFGAYWAGVLYWTATVDFGEQARLGLAAAPAVALLLVVGWQGWLPRRAWPWVHGTVVAVFVGLAVWPLPTLWANWQPPRPLPADATPARALDATTAAGAEVVGVDFPAGAALVAGDALPVRLTLGATRVITEDLTLFLHLSDARDTLLYHFDGVPADGRHPTRQWQPGAPFADDYTVRPATPVTEPTLATLTAGFYPFEQRNSRVTLTDAAGNPVGDRLVLGHVRLLPAPPQFAPADAAPVASWSGGIDLLAAAVAPYDEARDLQLTWRTRALQARDWTVFVQLLDGENTVLWQEDRQPQAGMAPTSTWLVDEVIADHYTVPQDARAMRLIVGLYDAATGARDTLTVPTPGADFFTVAP